MYSLKSTCSVTPTPNNPNPFLLPSPRDDIPPEAHSYLQSGVLDSMVQTQLDNYQTQIIINYGMETQLRDLTIHPKYPFIHLFKLFGVGPFPTKLLRFLWYLLYGYHIAIEVYVGFLLKSLKDLGQFPQPPNFY